MVRISASASSSRTRASLASSSCTRSINLQLHQGSYSVPDLNCDMISSVKVVTKCKLGSAHIMQLVDNSNQARRSSVQVLIA